MWGDTTCGETQHVGRHDMWGDTICRETLHVGRHDMWEALYYVLILTDRQRSSKGRY